MNLLCFLFGISDNIVINKLSSVEIVWEAFFFVFLAEK